MIDHGGIPEPPAAPAKRKHNPTLALTGAYFGTNSLMARPHVFGVYVFGKDHRRRCLDRTAA
jgi:hypothetical protein